MSKRADNDIINLLRTIAAGAGGGSGITAVVQDTAPQLGGTLDFNGHGALYASKFRVKTDGSFQLFNPTTSLYHTLSISGADGAVVLAFGAGES